jgi:ABC-type glycerol-3-phosphate transport system permease component
MPAFDEMSFRFILAVLLLIVGLLFLFGLFRFGTTLFETRSSRLLDELREFLRHGPGPDLRRYRWWTDSLSNWYQTYLEKRNDFWEHYGQVALAVLIVVVLAVLLLAKVISAEAGLPILSAVAGFAIAKTSGSSTNNRRPELPNSNDE